MFGNLMRECGVVDTSGRGALAEAQGWREGDRVEVVETAVLKLTEFITVQELANRMAERGGEVVDALEELQPVKAIDGQALPALGREVAPGDAELLAQSGSAPDFSMVFGDGNQVRASLA